MKTLISLAGLTTLICGTLVYASPNPDQGTVNITVVDEHGTVVPDAPVYIYGEYRTHFVGGADIPGTTTFSMKEGEYRVSSALIKKNGEDFDRFASNEAHVSIVAGDNVSLVLTLKPLSNPDQQAESYGTLHVAGLPGVLTNN